MLPENLAADANFRECFDREARAISQLEHPHICGLYDVGDQAGTAYLVMQYLEGETLADRLVKGALPLEQALTLFEGRYGATCCMRPYDVTADGRRFLMVQQKERPAVSVSNMVLVQNWFEELNARVPTN